MRVSELYEYYQSNWTKVSRELNIAYSSLQNWRKWGYIPLKSQAHIEKKTKGLFVTKIEHAEPPQKGD